MDKQSFRDMCAAMVAQGLAGVTGQMARNPSGLAAVAFDVADAMAAERERRERAGSPR